MAGKSIRVGGQVVSGTPRELALSVDLQLVQTVADGIEAEAGQMAAVEFNTAIAVSMLHHVAVKFGRSTALAIAAAAILQLQKLEPDTTPAPTGVGTLQ